MPIIDIADFIPRGFRVSREARDRYRFPATLICAQGNAFFPTFRAARLFVQQVNDRRDLLRHPERTARASHLNAMGLIDEIMRYVVDQYQRQRAPQALAQALAWLDAELGRDVVDATFAQFLTLFPTQAIYQGTMTVEVFLQGEENRQFALEELLMVWLVGMNPAYGRYRDLFDEAPLQDTAYPQIIEALQAFFTTQPTFGPEEQMLVDMLRSPAIAVPHSLSGQLRYILSHWGFLLGSYLYRLLGSLDFIQEEEKAIFHGPGPARVYEYSSMLDEPERFSQDKDWMPCLVMIAKNTYVWLDQLSKRYGRAITRLDDIPDEELDTLARRGFTGLWLIGLWERSRASKLIKQYCGNGDAVASAYSLMEYTAAGDLGGEEALMRLRARAWQRGIRLASDMVPNHMGIDSRWVIEHPDWFVALDYSPFPSYSFNGGDLSDDPRVGLFIEDHYYSRNDAAVVFKRLDRWTGDVKYIYHGNDGTNMPWNDTAQLNYLLPEVREAVIQTILHVARQFPIIRFDAAMTLAKKHYQRLWFPEPGNGGAIPSRAEHGLARPQFDEVFPVEFWREVVDRVAQEVPDTLLLAEAFWLMEGYFVRTLGMHRVYNSAFMNMLRDEENANYRSVLKNTMEFDLDILKRFVNFMNNPDERTAVDQFGTGDKYFGVCTVMCTLPGLPMFGHGQIEGFAEKYGMEYRRAYWDEQPNGWLIDRHEREVFPLLHRRRVFAEAAHFRLYDFYAPEGYVNEDVLAYSNRAGDECGLIIYHNKYASARGWIRTSAGWLDKETKQIKQCTLGEGLGLRAEDGCYVVFRDYSTGLEYIRPSRELCERGLYVELNAYQYHTFLDFREVRDTTGLYGRIHAMLNGSGVPSIDEAVRELYLRPVHEPFMALADADLFRRLLAARITDADTLPDADLLDEVEAKVAAVCAAARDFANGRGDAVAIARATRDQMEAVLRLPMLAKQFPLLCVEDETFAADLCPALDDESAWYTLFAWALTHALGRVISEDDAAEYSRAWLDEWLLGTRLANAFRTLEMPDPEHALCVLRVLLAEQGWATTDDMTPAALADHWLQDADVQQLCGINEYDGTVWYNQEGLAACLRWLQTLAAATCTANTLASAADIARVLQGSREVILAFRAAEATANYRVADLRAAIAPAADDLTVAE